MGSNPEGRVTGKDLLVTTLRLVTEYPRRSASRAYNRPFTPAGRGVPRVPARRNGEAIFFRRNGGYIACDAECRLYCARWPEPGNE